MIVRLGLQNIGISPCPDRKETIDNSTVYEAPPIDECYSLQPPKKWRGTWVLGPGEHDGGFCPEGNITCTPGSRPAYDLDWRGRDYKGGAADEAEWGRSYAIEFVGRRTTYRIKSMLPINQPYMVVVDRVLSMKDAGPAPKS